MLRSFGPALLRSALRLIHPRAWASYSSSSSAAQAHPLVSGHLWRSFFYVPGNKIKMIQKIAQLPAKLPGTEYGTHIPDLVVLDCEDAVGLDQKVSRPAIKIFSFLKLKMFAILNGGARGWVSPNWPLIDTNFNSGLLISERITQ